MEQHPVPQNVTTFQFRLVGDMTLKQFGYLAGGVIIAYICYKLPLPFFFTWPLTFVAALGGFGLAFVPVEERPMDVWVTSFVKNIYSPTQFLWQKAPPPPPSSLVNAQTIPVQPAQFLPQRVQQPAPQQVASRPVSGVLQGIYSQPTPVAHASSGPFDWLTKLFKPSPKQPIPATQSAPAIPTPSVTGRHLDTTPPPKVAPHEAPSAVEQVKKREEELTTKAIEIKGALEEKAQTQARILELQQQLTQVLQDRDHMQQELSSLRTNPTPLPQPAMPVATVPAANPPTASSIATPLGPNTQTVKIITPEGAVKAGLPRLTTFPNVVTGITRDSDSNLLPGVLVTVRDKDGVPLRALKTNRLGQFGASTPLANGTYFVEIEDPRTRYTFDRVQITLNGSIVPALEIIAKSQKEISRNKLAKEIFGT